jgi:hypothetical protein
MSWPFIRREWGAVTFVLTVLVGVLAVPIALYFEHPSGSEGAGPAAQPKPAASATPTPGH